MPPGVRAAMLFSHFSHSRYARGAEDGLSLPTHVFQSILPAANYATGNYAKFPLSRSPPSHVLEFLLTSSCQNFVTLERKAICYDPGNSIQALQLCNTPSTQQEITQNFLHHVRLQDSCEKSVI